MTLKSQILNESGFSCNITHLGKNYLNQPGLMETNVLDLTYFMLSHDGHLPNQVDLHSFIYFINETFSR